MKQMSLNESGFERKTKRTRKCEFFDEMNLAVPWSELVSLNAPHAPQRSAKGGRPPFAVETMQQIHFLQQWFNLSDPAMEETLHDMALFRDFVDLDAGEDHLPDESTVLRFCHLLEAHNLGIRIQATVNASLRTKSLLPREGTAVDATLIAAPSSNKNNRGKRNPEIHQTKKRNPWHYGMKAHAGVDADSGLVHTVTATAANAHDITQAHVLLHGQEADVFADSGYLGVQNREEVQTRHPDVNWHIAMMPGKRKVLKKDTPKGALLDKLEQTMARIRAKVEHPFWVINQKFGYTKVRYRGVDKNTANLMTLFALTNLWMVRKRLLSIGTHG